MFESKTYAEIRNCGCWLINLAQGVAVLPCKAHESAVLGCIKEADR